MVGGATNSRVGREMSWNFVKDKWDEFYQRYPGGFLQARLVKFATEGFASEAMVRGDPSLFLLLLPFLSFCFFFLTLFLSLFSVFLFFFFFGLFLSFSVSMLSIFPSPYSFAF